MFITEWRMVFLKLPYGKNRLGGIKTLNSFLLVLKPLIHNLLL